MDPNSIQQDISNIQGMYGRFGGHQAPSMQTPPQFPQKSPEVGGDSTNGHKKALLQKLMTNLLSKPGRSMHEIINGVKSAIGAYKNYSKEWDTLVNMTGAGAASSSPATAGSPSGIQKIMQSVQQKRQSTDGSGGPGVMPQGNPNGMPPQARGTPALGNPAQRPQMGMPGSPVPPSPQPRPPQQQDTSMPVPPTMQPPQTTVNPPANGIPPMGSMPNIPPIAGQPQASSFHRPAPVNTLGIWGH